jgi:NTP pyrophosphatase (non-canonical NTP hydrolase)
MAYLQENPMALDMNVYQRKALTTAVYPKDIGLEYTVLGLVGEAGELANKLKKIVRGDVVRSTDTENQLAEELGDVLWYVAMVAKELGYNLSEIGHKNLLKLADRAARNQIKGSGDNR